MAEDNSRSAFLTEGLKSYLDAFSALSAFEREVQELIKRVLVERISELSKVIGRADLATDNIRSVGLEGGEGQVAVGVSFDAPDTWGNSHRP